MNKDLACAIYTRKSSEEGLEQGFNSLDAQREACSAYIASQAGEGWCRFDRSYDDGGYSGGTMERPGLATLLADIERGVIQIVVVYKVDRLTRSLADFMRIVAAFDARQVSFVSVTQAFNTTTSMGRLTLNMLLSFAQFEREVTGERIRDKIAASKAKGIWMGGRVPVGYDVVQQKLVVNSTAAETVRMIFTRYLDLGSLKSLGEELRLGGIRSRRWITKAGVTEGGAEFSLGALRYLLSNPVYLGTVRHRERLHESVHQPIISADVWAAVQQKLADRCGRKVRGPRGGVENLLQGILFDDRGHPMRLTYANRRGQRYRYYASATAISGDRANAGSLPRIGVGVLDRFVLERCAPLLSSGWRSDDGLERRVQTALKRASVGADRIQISLLPEAIIATASLPEDVSIASDEVVVSSAIRLKHCKGSCPIRWCTSAKAS